jgi:uncharacterized protein (TIGR00375 family)
MDRTGAAAGPVNEFVDIASWIADLHIHSKYSIACSRDLTVASLAAAAMSKGIALLGTGDFTHPAWFEHLRADLVPAEPGLFAPTPELLATIRRSLPPIIAARDVRFTYSVEISTIYKRADRTRKVHHLVYMPDVDAAARFNARLGRVGNLGSDGRPILGLDSRDLLDIVLSASEDGYLVPAHIWTPWFSALGSKSGFDRIADCYADLADHIFAVETGLSSDPAMNWRVPSLDRYRLVSNSDAHSLFTLGREATVLTAERDYFSVRDALRTGRGLAGTLEFFPEEGKYHADGHRACGVNWLPAETADQNGVCVKCGKPVTVGVLSRVEDLAGRPVGERPATAHETTVEHLVQLAEILGEIHGVGARSRSVLRRIDALVAALGPELHILRSAPLDDVTKYGGELLGEAIRRLRTGDVRRTAGYDGEYGVIRLFDPGEIRAARSDALFDAALGTPGRPHAVPANPRSRTPRQRVARPAADRPTSLTESQTTAPQDADEPMLAGLEEVGSGLLDRLDAMQRVAATAPGGPMLIVAGPGSGKTSTLTHRIAYLCAELGVRPEQCLAITFTRRAAEEVAERLRTLLGPAGDAVTVSTFHALCLAILREHATSARLSTTFRVAEDADRVAALAEAAGDGLPGTARPRRALAEPMESAARARYVAALRARDAVDLDELVPLTIDLLNNSPQLAAAYRHRWPWLFVDEYQDVDAAQYTVLRLLCRPDGNLCAIGDPDQAIYSFRGADVSFFLRFSADFTDARMVRLARNYRSAAPIVVAALQAIAPTTLVRGRRLEPARSAPDAPPVGRYAAASVADEADFVVRTIDGLVGGMSHRSLDSGRVDGRDPTGGAVSFADIAVLYRTDAQAAPIVEALSRAGIPVQKRSHDRLRDRVGVAAIARELRFVAGVRHGSVNAHLRRAAADVVARLRTPTLDTDLSLALNETDVHVAVDLLGPLAERCGDDIDAFLTEIATDAEVDALDSRAQAVTLLTVHASKGLEFPVVFLVGCEDGILPLRFAGRDGAATDAGVTEAGVPQAGVTEAGTSQAEAAEAAIAEERRLFFVGLTRARDRLFVSHVRRRRWRGAERDMRPSRFLDDIDPRLFGDLGDPVPRRPRDQQLRLL